MNKFLIITVLFLSACVAPRPEINSVADAIVVTSADIETAAQTVKNLCGNVEAGGPCMAGALISTETKEGFKLNLQKAQDSIVVANRLLASGSVNEAADKLAIAESILRILQAELARRAQ